jgi:hypothetical protein
LEREELKVPLSELKLVLLLELEALLLVLELNVSLLLGPEAPL